LRGRRGEALGLFGFGVRVLRGSEMNKVKKKRKTHGFVNEFNFYFYRCN
jgi:hypothetical protein